LVASLNNTPGLYSKLTYLQSPLGVALLLHFQWSLYSLRATVAISDLVSSNLDNFPVECNAVQLLLHLQVLLYVKIIVWFIVRFYIISKYYIDKLHKYILYKKICDYNVLTFRCHPSKVMKKTFDFFHHWLTLIMFFFTISSKQSEIYDQESIYV
jgi:hypothetical protein